VGNIKVGTCGFGYYKPAGNWKQKYESKLQAYSDAFRVVEINRTFYGLPRVKTTQRWRDEVLGDFEFTLKAWQAVTHATTSMTWRKRTEKLTEKQKKNFGNLRSNKEVIEAWEKTKARAEALEAAVCVFQCPASFNCRSENEKNTRRFFERIDRGGLDPAWEPRGDWNEHPEKIEALCRDLGLIHVVDLMRREPLSDQRIAYIRLHGLNRKEYDYRYDYSDSELEELAEKLTRLGRRHDTVYCMFNNDNMFANAHTLMTLLEG
jgi:uncharacterized protein YecE (DUF72 family)